MVQITYTLRLDMRDTGIVNTSLRLKQGDSGMKIAVNVFNGGVSAFDSSTTPKIVFRRPDGASVMADMTVESSLYSYTLVGNELQVPGKELIDIKFPIGAEGRESTMSCSIEVVPDTITPNTHGSGIYDNDLAVLVEEATEAAETVQEVVGDSEAWADGTRGGVPVGPDDPAYHNNSKYWSEQANPTALANLTDVDVDGVVNGDLLQYNSTTHKWEASNTVIEQVEDNASDISDLNDEFYDAWKKNGAYNLLENHAVTVVSNGITFTVSSDGTVDVHGTLSANSSTLYIYAQASHGNLPIPNGSYRMVGTPSSITGTATAYLNFWNCDGAGQNRIENGSGLNITYASGNVCNFALVVTGGTGKTIDHAIFKPMITTDLNATYNDYQPYAKTNRELTKGAARTASITIDGTVVKTDRASHVYYDLINRTCTFDLQLTVGTYANYSNFVTGLPRPKSANIFPCVCLNNSRNIGIATLTDSGTTGQMYFTGLSTAPNFATNDQVTITGSYIISDAVTS